MKTDDVVEGAPTANSKAIPQREKSEEQDEASMEIPTVPSMDFSQSSANTSQWTTSLLSDRKSFTSSSTTMTRCTRLRLEHPQPSLPQRLNRINCAKEWQKSATHIISHISAYASQSKKKGCRLALLPLTLLLDCQRLPWQQTSLASVCCGFLIADRY